MFRSTLLGLFAFLFVPAAKADNYAALQSICANQAAWEKAEPGLEGAGAARKPLIFEQILNQNTIVRVVYNCDTDKVEALAESILGVWPASTPANFATSITDDVTLVFDEKTDLLGITIRGISLVLTVNEPTLVKSNLEFILHLDVVKTKTGKKIRFSKDRFHMFKEDESTYMITTSNSMEQSTLNVGARLSYRLLFPSDLVISNSSGFLKSDWKNRQFNYLSVFSALASRSVVPKL